MEQKFLRDKIRDLDLRLIDLSEYLEVSRPTMYKYIELYEQGHKEEINSRVLTLFDYIENNYSNISKNNVINFILNNIVRVEAENISKNESKRIKIKNLLKKENKSKENFIYMLTEDNFFDPILDYLMECRKLSDKKLSDEEIEFIKPLEELYKTQGFKIKLKKGGSK